MTKDIHNSPSLNATSGVCDVSALPSSNHVNKQMNLGMTGNKRKDEVNERPNEKGAGNWSAPWLSHAIYEYLKTHKNSDSVDIVSHFKIRADIIMIALNDLVKNGKVQRRMNGMNSRYEILN